MAFNVVTTQAAAGIGRAGTKSSIIAAMRESLGRWNERARIRSELRSMSVRELADLGLMESDIEDVARGNYARP